MSRVVKTTDRCPDVLVVVGGHRRRCKFQSGHKGEHWYIPIEPPLTDPWSSAPESA